MMTKAPSKKIPYLKKTPNQDIMLPLIFVWSAIIILKNFNVFGDTFIADVLYFAFSIILLVGTIIALSFDYITTEEVPFKDSALATQQEICLALNHIGYRPQENGVKDTLTFTRSRAFGVLPLTIVFGEKSFRITASKRIINRLKMRLEVV